MLRATDNKGFTLLELMIVLFLITLVLGLSSVYFAATMPSHKLSAETRALSATLRHARALAQISGERRTVTLDLDARQYGIEGLGRKAIDPLITVRVIDPLAGEVRSGAYPFVFQPVGGAQGGTIILGNGKKEYKIDLDPIVGTVVIK